MKNLVIGILVLSTIISCKDEKRELQSNEVFGTLPCADCAGINIQLELKENNQYEMEYLYLEEGASLERESGKYNYLNDSILTFDSPLLSNLLITEKSLIKLDKDNKRIETKLKEKYKLYPTKPDKFTLNPIDSIPKMTFKAFGVEPSWKLTIDSQQKVGIEFSNISPNEFSLKAPFVSPEIKDNKIEYKAETESGILEISIEVEKCTDGMSDNTYSHRVSVRAKTGIMKEFEEFSGCGYYVENK